MERESQPNHVQDVASSERTPEEQLLYDIFSNEHEDNEQRYPEWQERDPITGEVPE